MPAIAAAIDFLHNRLVKCKDVKPLDILLCEKVTGAIGLSITDVGETKV